MSNAAQLNKTDLEALMPDLTNRFEFLGSQPIGEPSGFGSVWKAYDTWLNRHVAIKISDTDLREEVRLCRDIEGQTVRIYDYYRSDRWNAYAMELLETPWKTVDAVIEERTYSKGDLQHYFDCFQVAYAVLKALSDMHGLPYSREGRHVHADVQPRNIFIRWEPKRRAQSVFRLPQHTDIVKIVDLGISLPRGKIYFAAHPLYAYPGRTVAHLGHDLYSLAIVFLELVTGERPGHETMKNSTRILEHVLDRSSGSLYMDNIVIEFANQAARAAATPSITSKKLMALLDLNIFDLAPDHLFAVKEISKKVNGGLTKSEMAELLFPAFAKQCSWKNKTADRVASLENLVKDMTNEALLTCDNKKYFLGF